MANDPVNNIDPNGRVIGKLIKLVRNIQKARGNPVKGGLDTVQGVLDDVGTLTDGQANLDDAGAIVSLVTGVDKKDQAAIKGAAKARSAAKRRASRSAQRKAGVSTSKPGKDTQGRGFKKPRHQIKPGGAANGKDAGIIDGSQDRNNGPSHPRAMDAGNIKPTQLALKQIVQVFLELLIILKVKNHSDG